MFFTQDSILEDQGALYNSQISVNYPLTKFTTTAILENVPSHSALYNFKQTYGGNVQNTQPPAMRGFFMPATLCDCTNLSSVARDKIPASGKTCSVSVRTLEGTRQLYCCCNFKKSYEVSAMQNATTHSTATPVVIAKGLSPVSNSTCCILPSDVLLNAIVTAKHKRQQDDRANAYAELLKYFHKAIFSAFFTETNGNLSEVSRLTGLHRETVKTYAVLAEVDMTGTGRVGGAA